jgi:hypothetical protein
MTSLTIAVGVFFKEIIPVIIFVVFSSIIFFKTWYLDNSNSLSFDEFGLYYGTCHCLHGKDWSRKAVFAHHRKYRKLLP